MKLIFLSTLSLRRATIFGKINTRGSIFLSTLSLRRATISSSSAETAKTSFLSTLSLRRATRVELFHTTARLYFYPRSPCGERQVKYTSTGLNIFISIHALLAESDALTDDVATGGKIFLSTLSLRRATDLSYFYIIKITDFYPRSPCGERPYQRQIDQKSRSISIHALLAESDPSMTVLHCKTLNFYPRSPCGERPKIPPYQL